MHMFCKAYLLKDLRQFSGWSEKAASSGMVNADDTICFIWDDFTVVKDPVYDRDVIFDAVTPEWQTFCQTTLQFAIPKDVAL